MKTEKNILIAFLLNLFFAIIEFVGGLYTNSVAIISDSIHDLGDTLSIGISYLLEKKSKQKPDEIYTYGYVRYSLLGSILTTTILICSSVFVIYNALIRLMNPVDINYNGMILFAIIGFITNLIASYVTKDGESLNQKAVNVHMLEDVLGWLVVLFGAVIMKFTNLTAIDALLSILVAIFILVNALKNLNEIVNIFLEKKPNNINIEGLKEHILKIKGIKDIHHIHIRSIDGFNNYLTMHVVVDKYNSKIKRELKEELHEHNIIHSTIEFEEKDEQCESIDCEIKPSNHTHHHHHH